MPATINTYPNYFSKWHEYPLFMTVRISKKLVMPSYLSLSLAYLNTFFFPKKLNEDAVWLNNNLVLVWSWQEKDE